MRNSKTKRLGGLEVDDQLEFGRLYHRQIGRFDALENFSDVDSGLAIPVDKVGCVTDKTTRFGEFAITVDRGQFIAGR